MNASRKDILRRFFISGLGVVFGFIVAAIVIVVQKKPVGASLSALIEGSLGSSFAVGNTLNKAAPLLLVALGFILANAAGLVSIGGEGQIFMGGSAAVATAIAVGDLPKPLPLILAMIAGFAGGGAWSAVAGWLKARLSVNEVISTLLLNYIAINFTEFLVDQKGLLRDGENEPQSALVPGSARFGRLFPGTASTLHTGIFVAIAAAFIVWFVLRRTVPGFRIRMLGQNPKMAARSGISLRSMSVRVMFAAGGLAGLAGTSMMLGDQYRLTPNFSPGYGFAGIAVALIAMNNSLAAIPAALLFGALQAGGNLLEAKVQVPQALVSVIQGAIILAVAGMALLLKKTSAVVVSDAEPPDPAQSGGAGSPVEPATSAAGALAKGATA